MSPEEVTAATTTVVRHIVSIARTAIGPDGVMMRLPEEDSGVMRAAFVTQLAETAMKILDGEDPTAGDVRDGGQS